MIKEYRTLSIGGLPSKITDNGTYGNAWLLPVRGRRAGPLKPNIPGRQEGKERIAGRMLWKRLIRPVRVLRGRTQAIDHSERSFKCAPYWFSPPPNPRGSSPKR